MFSAREEHLQRFSPREPNFKKTSDSAWKIHFGMFSAREAHLHRFSPRESNLQKNFRFGLENSFLHDLSSGSAFAPIFSKWKGHAQVRYAECRGSCMCTNDNCPYKVLYGVINKTRFENSGNQCKVCGSEGKYVPCHARRYVSYGKRKVKVFHHGSHTCQSIVKTTRNVQKIKELVKNNPNIKPAEIQSTIVLSAFRNQMDWQTVEKEAASVVNKKQISNIKQKIRGETEPHGHNFEAIVKFKEYCDKKDKLYVFKINDRRGNPDQPSFMFKSSEAKMKLAVAMDNEKDDFLSEEFCFFDGKHISLPPSTREANTTSYNGGRERNHGKRGTILETF